MLLAFSENECLREMVIGDQIHLLKRGLVATHHAIVKWMFHQHDGLSLDGIDALPRSSFVLRHVYVPFDGIMI